MTQFIVSLAALALGLAIDGCASQRSHSDPSETPRAPASGPADHGKSNARLTALAEENGIALPKGLDDEHRAALARLETMSGHDFDVAYMGRQVGDHQKTVLLLAWEVSSGQDAEIKGFAADTLPVVMTHLDSAKRILAGLTGQAALPTARPPLPIHQDQGA